MDRLKTIFQTAMSLLLVAVFYTPLHAETIEVTDQTVRRAVQRAVEYIYSQQNEQGTWDLEKRANQRLWDPEGVQYGGKTALATYALLAAGEELNGNPRLASAVKFLEATPFTGSYAMGMRAHVWAQLPEAYQKNLIRDANLLIRGQSEMEGKVGTHHYHIEAVNGGDHSVTQYAALGIWEAAKRGVPISREYWQRLESHLIDAQNGDGGWGYTPDMPSRGSMTSAGLTLLYITRDHLHREAYIDLDAQGVAEVDRAIARGLGWFDRHFQVKTHPGGPDIYLHYYLLGIERVGEASGLTEFNGIDWYREGATYLLNHQAKSGAWETRNPLVDTAFATVFLARGQRPLALGKLQIPDTRWQARPRDAANLTDWLSRETEHALGWQVVEIDAPIAHWLESPFLLLTGSQAIDWREEQIAQIRSYLDRGGLLVTAADEGSEAFTQSIHRLARHLDPENPLRELAADDPLFRLVYPADPTRLTLLSQHSGVRHRILHFPEDLGRMLQRHQPRRPDPSMSLLGNIYHYATAKGTVRSRLAAGYADSDEPTTVKQRVRVGRLRHSGRWNPEPRAWDQLARYLAGANELEVVLETVDFDELAACKLPLVHLAGVGVAGLGEAEARAVEQYITNGGTLLIEAVGGDVTFTHAAVRLIREAYPGRAARPISANASIFVPIGDELPRLGRPIYTRALREQGGLPIRQWRLRSLTVGGRDAIYLSGEDISHACLDRPRWGVLGYDTQTARQLMARLLLMHAEPIPIPPDNELPSGSDLVPALDPPAVPLDDDANDVNVN